MENGRYFLRPGAGSSGSDDGTATAASTTTEVNTGRKRIKTAQAAVGREFFFAMDEDACTKKGQSETDCRKVAVASLSQAGCADFTHYPNLNVLSAACFGPLESTPRAAELKTLGQLKAMPLFKGVTANNKVQGLFAKSLFQTKAYRKNYNGGEPLVASSITMSSGLRAMKKAAGLNIKPFSPTIPTTTTGTATALSNASSPVGGSIPWQPPADDNWGLDRINQEDMRLDGNAASCQSKGAGVTIFVVDTGCRASHQEFGGRATAQPVVLPDGTRVSASAEDDNGHGTHVAGIAAGASVGVAPLATVKCLKSLDAKGSGPLSFTVAALDNIAAERKANPGVPMIASLSLSTPNSKTLNAMVAKLANMGVVVVVAAGNDGKAASGYSPGSEPSAITVGATMMPPPTAPPMLQGKPDKRDVYSNQGPVVDMYAPGTNVYSADIGGDAAYKYRTGTSQAAPFVSGAVACILGDALAATGQTSCRNAESFVALLANPSVRVQQLAGGGARKAKANERPMLYVPPEASYKLTCPVGGGGR